MRRHCCLLFFLFYYYLLLLLLFEIIVVLLFSSSPSSFQREAKRTEKIPPNRSTTISIKHTRATRNLHNLWNPLYYTLTHRISYTPKQFLRQACSMFRSFLRALYVCNKFRAVDNWNYGKLCTRYEPAPGTKYVEASLGALNSYLLRDDGVVVRLAGWCIHAQQKISCEFIPPPKVKYIHVSSGYFNSYLLRDDGKVDMIKGAGKIKKTIVPPPSTRYIQIIAGHMWTCLLRDDGIIEWTKGGGKINKSTACRDNGVIYTTITSSSAEAESKQLYALRSDGSADKFVCMSRLSVFKLVGNVKCANTIDADVKYVSGSTCPHATYLVRSDGAVDKIKTGVKVAYTLNPPPGQYYVAACAGTAASYLLRSDGKIDRTTRNGIVSSTQEAPVDVQSVSETCTLM